MDAKLRNLRKQFKAELLSKDSGEDVVFSLWNGAMLYDVGEFNPNFLGAEKMIFLLNSWIDVSVELGLKLEINQY